MSRSIAPKIFFINGKRLVQHCDAKRRFAGTVMILSAPEGGLVSAFHCAKSTEYEILDAKSNF
jgi:hypothetical protein